MNINDKKLAKSKLEEVLKQTRKWFLFAGFFSMFINLLMLVPSLYMLQVYDRVMTSRSLETLLFLTVIVAVLFLTMGLLEVIRSRILIRIGNKIDLELSPKLFDLIFEQARLKPGQVTPAPINDLVKLRQYMTGNGVFAFFDAPWFPFYLFVMYLFSPTFALFTVFAAIVLFTITIINEKSTKTALARANQLNNQSTFFVSKNIQNAEIIHAMGMNKAIKNKWLEKHLAFLTTQSEASEQAGKWANLSKTLRQFFQSLTYGLGAYLAIKGEISPGTIIAGAVLMGRALAPLDLLTNSWKGFSDAKGAYKRLNELLKEFNETKETMDLPAPKGELSIENIMVVPPLAKVPAIKGVNMKIPSGSTVGVIGPSGSGKSTLARAVLGVWPLYAGTVRLDGADVHKWDSEKLGKYIGYLPQDIELFEGTISENIARLGEVDATKVVEAAKIAGVHEMILRLPDGYDTKIGAGGIGLSGGQRQRVGLARAIYDNPVLVVLDEPNSNLDAAGEISLMNTIKYLKEKGSTVIIISHKTDILQITDLIAVLKDGTLQMYGKTPEVLVKLGFATVATKNVEQKAVAPKVSLSKPKG